MSSSAKLTVATSFPVYPPRGGGQRRIFGLYSALARQGLNVDVVALVESRARGGAHQIAPGVREIRIPKSPEHDGEEFALQAAAGVPITDIGLALLHELTPAYGHAIAESAVDAAAVVASHPFSQPAIAAAAGAAPLIYESHNVELDLKESLLAGAEAAARAELLGAVRAAEAACCTEAALVTVCSERDADRLAELYDVDAGTMVPVPNGIDPEAHPFADGALRRARKARLGLGDTFVAVFLGSWHEPNIVAVRDVLGAAGKVEDMRFLVVGSVGLPFAGEPMPENVDFCGVVDDGFVRSVLGVADAALNPMRWGSGTNIKMLDYALAGAPVVSSAFGARALGLEPGRHYLQAEPDRLADALVELRAEDPAATDARIRAAHDAVRARFAWPVIAEGWRMQPVMRELLDGVMA